MPRSRWLKRLLVMLLSVALLAAVTLPFLEWYLNERLLPGVIRPAFLERVSDALGAPCALQSLRYEPLRGIVATGLVLEDPDTHTPLLQIAQVRIPLHILPLVHRKILVINAVEVLEPVVVLRRAADGRWDLPRVQRPAASPPSGWSVVVRSLHVRRGTLTLHDDAATPPSALTLREMNGKATLGLPRRLTFRAQAALEQTPPALVTLSGRLDPASRTGTVTGRVQSLLLEHLRPYAATWLGPGDLHGTATGDLAITWAPEAPLHIEGTIALQDPTVPLPTGTLTGLGPALQANAAVSIERDPRRVTAYEVTMTPHALRWVPRNTRLPPIEHLSGTLVLSPGESSADLTGSIQEIPYHLTGAFQRAPELTLRWQLDSSMVTSTGVGRIEEPGSLTLRGSVRAGRSHLDATAAVPLTATGEFRVEGTASLTPEEFVTLLPTWQPALHHVVLRDPAALAFSVTAPERAPATWRGAASLTVPQVQLGERLILTELTGNLEASGGTATLAMSVAWPPGGTGTVTGALDLTRQELPFRLDAELRHADLSALARPPGSPDSRGVSGILNGTLHLEGSARAPQAVAGTGGIHVANGDLWHTPALGGLVGPLLSADALQIRFTEAAATFRIAEEHLTTTDLRLVSDELTIGGEGTIGFDQDLQGRVYVSSVSRLSAATESLGPVPQLLLDEASRAVSQVEIGGSLTHPTFRKSPTPPSELIKRQLQRGLEYLLKDALGGAPPP